MASQSKFDDLATSPPGPDSLLLCLWGPNSAARSTAGWCRRAPVGRAAHRFDRRPGDRRGRVGAGEASESGSQAVERAAKLRGADLLPRRPWALPPQNGRRRLLRRLPGRAPRTGSQWLYAFEKPPGPRSSGSRLRLRGPCGSGLPRRTLGGRALSAVGGCGGGACTKGDRPDASRAGDWPGLWLPSDAAGVVVVLARVAGRLPNVRTV